MPFLQALASGDLPVDKFSILVMYAALVSGATVPELPVDGLLSHDVTLYMLKLFVASKGSVGPCSGTIISWARISLVVSAYTLCRGVFSILRAFTVRHDLGADINSEDNLMTSPGLSVDLGIISAVWTSSVSTFSVVSS